MKILKLISALIIPLFIFSCTNSSQKGIENESAQGVNNEQSDEKDKVVEKKETPDMKFETYYNDRFGFSVDYPKDYLTPQGESDNGDGQAFISEDDETVFLAYRDFRAFAADMDETEILKYSYNEDIAQENINITYKYLGESYYVVSGYKNGKIFYQKTIVRDFELVTALIEYPQKDKELYDNICNRIFESLKWFRQEWQVV